MAKIERVKTYAGKDLETIFFRPMLTGEGAEELGIRVLYNMPVPTTLHFWRRAGDILQKFGTGGWNGSMPADKFQKTIPLAKVKAELGYSAEDYFSLVYEQIAGSPSVNLEDLSGTELEEAETRLFKQSIAESIRVTMWLGDTSRSDTRFNTFNGICTQIFNEFNDDLDTFPSYFYPDPSEGGIEDTLRQVWKNASPLLQDLKSQGDLAYFVTSDVYRAYEEQLDNSVLESAYLAKQNGRGELSFMGIPVIDLKLRGYLTSLSSPYKSFIILTDRRNLALAVNTSDFPGTEVRMWYNPDQMENRQRAVFMAGADYLLPELISLGLGE